jgi:hypothetical protein
LLGFAVTLLDAPAGTVTASPYLQVQTPEGGMNSAAQGNPNAA